jgi:CheY-like chemotaxis protein
MMAVETGQVPAPGFGSLRVLLIERVPSSQTSTSKLLRDAGYAVRPKVDCLKSSTDFANFAATRCPLAAS